MKNNKPLFQDFDPLKAFDWILAIEPEISSRFFYEDKYPFSNRNYVPESKKPRKDCFKWLVGHNESSMIFELDNTHKLPLTQRQELIKEITDWYKSFFSVWWSSYPSWWVHFHVFTSKDQLDRISKVKYKYILHNMQQLPLRAVIYDNKLYSRNRWNNFKCDYPENTLRRDDRSYNAVLKNDFLPWIEFRANNVFDIRLYWYYTWLTLMSLMWWTLPTIFTEDQSDRLVKWIQTTYWWEPSNSNPPSYDEFGRLHCSKLPHQIDLNSDKWKQHKTYLMDWFKTNLWIIYFILSVNWLTKAREALEEYIQEYMNIKIPAVPYDCINNKIIGLVDWSAKWYSIFHNGVKWFSNTKPSLRYLIRNLWLTPSFVQDWTLSLLSEAVMEAEIIQTEINNNTIPLTEDITQWQTWTTSIL